MNLNIGHILMEIGQNGYHKVMIVDQKILEL